VGTNFQAIRPPAGHSQRSDRNRSIAHAFVCDFCCLLFAQMLNAFLNAYSKFAVNASTPARLYLPSFHELAFFLLDLTLQVLRKICQLCLSGTLKPEYNKAHGGRLPA